MNNSYKILFATILLAAFSHSLASIKKDDKKALRAAAKANMDPTIAKNVAARRAARKEVFANATVTNTALASGQDLINIVIDADTPSVTATSSALTVASREITSTQQPITSASSRFSIRGGSRSTKFVGAAAAVAIVGIAIYKNKDSIKNALGYADTIESLTAKISAINTEIKELANNKVANKIKIKSLNTKRKVLEVKLANLQAKASDEQAII